MVDQKARKFLSLLIKTMMGRLGKFGLITKQEQEQWAEVVKELESQK